jgi:tight adherence protein B
MNRDAAAPVTSVPAAPVPVAAPSGRLDRYRTRLAAALEKADSRFTTERFMMLQGGLLIVLFAIGLLANPSLGAGIVFGILLAMGGWKGSWAWLSWQEKRLKERFMDQFSESVGLIANAVKSGLSVLQAFELVAKEMPRPISTEMGTVLQGVRIGIPLDVALEDWSARVESDDLRMFVTAISLQRQTGGPLSEILDILGDTVRERRRIQGQIKASTAQGRGSALFLTLLPVFFMLALYLLNPAYISLFFQHPLGLVMLAVGAGLDLLGMTVINRLVAIDF